MNMNAKPAQSSGPQLVVVILLAIVSLGTTLLIGINVLARRPSPTTNQPQQGLTAQGLSGQELIGQDLAGLGEAGSPQLMGTLPGFTLLDTHGQPFPSTQLHGRVWVADFIFTRCAGACAMMTSQMAQLQIELSQLPGWDDIRLVSISVDPDHDQPPILEQYAHLARADADQWLFLTGPRKEIWQLIRDGFKLPVFENPQDQAMPIAHSQKFVLVDRIGRIRGYYDGLTPEGRHALIQDLTLVANEASNPASPQ